MCNSIGSGFPLLWCEFCSRSPKVEITADYSYFRLNPGLPSVWNSQNLNGGGAQAALYFKPWLTFGGRSPRLRQLYAVPEVQFGIHLLRSR
jgi:hypothetical protein